MMYDFLGQFTKFLGVVMGILLMWIASSPRDYEYLIELKTACAVILIVALSLDAIRWVWTKKRSFAEESKNQREAEEQEWLKKEKARDREQWEEQLHREITREEALARVRNTSMIEMYKTQVDLMMKYKKEGANIDKDIFAMREKLLVLEGQENKAMVQDLMNTLNGL